MADEIFSFLGRGITNGRNAQVFLGRADGSKLSVVLPFDEASKLRCSLAEQARAGAGAHDPSIELEAEAAAALRYLRALADDASSPDGAAAVAGNLAAALRAAAQTRMALVAALSGSEGSERGPHG